MRLLLRLSKFFRCDFLCWQLRLLVQFSIISIFRAILNSHILQTVMLVQKLNRSNSFFGEIEFLAPSCSAGSTLTLNTLFGQTYRRFLELCSSFQIQCRAPQIYTQIRNRKFRKTARGSPQPQFHKFALHLR